MKIIRLNNNWNRVNTREELTKLLKAYRGVLTGPMLNYLNSLIELEFSVIREYISDSDRKALAELEIYKRIAIYNIYNRALNLLYQRKIKYNFSGNEDGLESLTISVPLNDNRSIKVFNFDYKGFHLGGGNEILDEYKTMRIGTISLYQSLESPELREAELNRVMDKLERLYDAHNPYPSRRGVVGGPRPQWTFKHEQEIEQYEKKFTELDRKKELNDMDKREIEITNQIRNLLLEDYNLTNKSFKEEIKPVFCSENSILQKTLVKRQPNLSITNNIKYI